MAERKASNKYYPPDWDPSSGSINRYKKSHPLRDRAKKIDQGILIVRFEMPFNIWCSNCNNHVAMGVRFNAEKSKTGNYYSTPIYKFRMKCHLCDNHFEIQTDPSKFDYVILNGARRQKRMTDTADDESNLDICDTSKSLSNLSSVEVDGFARDKIPDAMSRLERKIEDQLKSEAELPCLLELKQSRSKWKDSFAANQLIRSQFRDRRKKLERQKEADKKLLKKASLKIKLSKVDPEDKEIAKKLLAEASRVRMEELDELKRKKILNSSITIAGPVKKEIKPRTKTKIKIER